MLWSIHKHRFAESNPIPVKRALEEMGHITGGIRLSRLPLDARYHDAVCAVLVEAGLFG